MFFGEGFEHFIWDSVVTGGFVVFQIFDCVGNFAGGRMLEIVVSGPEKAHCLCYVLMKFGEFFLGWKGGALVFERFGDNVCLVFVCRVRLPILCKGRGVRLSIAK